MVTGTSNLAMEESRKKLPSFTDTIEMKLRNNLYIN